MSTHCSNKTKKSAYHVFVRTLRNVRDNRIITYPIVVAMTMIFFCCIDNYSCFLPTLTSNILFQAASLSGRLDLVRLLVEYGANVEEQNIVCNTSIFYFDKFANNSIDLFVTFEIIRGPPGQIFF